MKYVINGGAPLTGAINVSGSKNFSIKAMCVSLLSESIVEYFNMPKHTDVQLTSELIESTGATVIWEGDVLKIDASKVTRGVIVPKSGTNRITHLLGAALIHKFDTVKFPKAEGCTLGKREDGFHIDSFQAFGAEVMDTSDGYIMHRKAPLKGTSITLPMPSVGATETTLILAACANGVSYIYNCAMEPEIVEMITMLQIMGAKIYWMDDRSLCVTGVSYLNGGSVYVDGDLLEACSWAALACITNGEITVNGISPEKLGSFLGYYRLLGGEMHCNSNRSLTFSKNKSLEAIHLETGVFPKFRTDLQPIIATMCAFAEGISTIHETLYENRVLYVEDFKKFGIEAYSTAYCLGTPCRFMNKYSHTAIIKGSSNRKIKGSKEELIVSNIRSGMALILLAAAAEGSTTLDNVEIIERGYCSLVDKLKSIGVSIEVVKKNLAFIPKF